MTDFGKNPRAIDGTPLRARHQLQLGRKAFQRTVDSTANMAINGVNDSITVIWNGTGAGDTGGDWTRVAQGTETAGSMHSGTNGLDSGVRSAGQDTRFDNGSNIDIAGTYDSVSFWMQPKAFPGGSRLDIRWKTVGGGTPGTKLDVANYITTYDLDVWQKVTIPIADFALGADVAKLELTYAAAAGQHFYFDDFELNSGGIGPKAFRVQSPAGVVWHVEKVTLVIAAGDTGWNSDAFANIAGGLTNGLLLTYKNIGPSPVTHWSINVKNNAELFGQYDVINNVDFAGTDLMIVFALDPDISSVILVDDDDVLEFTVRDDIDTLNKARAFLHYGEEVVS